MPLAKLALRVPNTGEVIPFSGEVIVGRGAAADIALDHSTVSRRHASLRLDGATVVVRDLDSANGTWLNEERVFDATRAEHGDVLRLGVVELRLEIDARAPDHDPSATPTEILAAVS
jgi:pSer/pThr/pTyr-binding forkhead associated (FHA) protein